MRIASARILESLIANMGRRITCIAWRGASALGLVVLEQGGCKVGNEVYGRMDQAWIKHELGIAYARYTGHALNRFLQWQESTTLL